MDMQCIMKDMIVRMMKQNMENIKESYKKNLTQAL